MSCSKILKFDKSKLLFVTLNFDEKGSVSSEFLLSDDVSDFYNVLLFHRSSSPDELKESMLSNAENECSSNDTCTDSTVRLIFNSSTIYVPWSVHTSMMPGGPVE